MTRRVGFGDEDKKPEAKGKMTVADQAMERFRKRAKAKAAREQQQTTQNRGKFKKILFLFLWLVVWVGMAGAMIYSMASDGLQTNLFGLVIVTAATVFVVSRVITRIIKAFRGDPGPLDRPDNF